MPPASESTITAPAADAWLIEPFQNGVLQRSRELWAYRYLWWYFASRTLQAMYRRSALGWVWIVMRVAGPVGITAIFFGGVLQVPSNGLPYFLFLLCGMTTWMVFERGLLFITRSLEQNRRLVTKVYFPRLILPFAAVSPALLFLAILLIVLGGTVIYFYRTAGILYVTLRPQLFMAVLAVAMSFAFAIGVGLWTSVLQARYRDVRQGLRHFMPFWMYLTPVTYPLTMIPEKWRWISELNPMTAVVESFRWGMLGEGTLNVRGLTQSVALIAVTMVLGIWFFSREESASVDKL